MKKVIFWVISTTVSLCALAQTTTNELPYGLQQKNTEQSRLSQIVLPPPDVRQLAIEDSISEFRVAVVDSVNYQVQSGGLRFACPVLVNYTPENSGTWQTLPNGDKLWRLKVKISNALSTHTFYDSFWLPKGGKFFVYSEETGQFIGAVTSELIKGSKNDPARFATALIYGESIVYEYYQPASVTDTAVIVINRIDYGYRNINNPYQKRRKEIGDADPCNEDICSTNNFQNERNTVARIMVPAGTGSYWYTGYLLNNTANDNTPYLLTSIHAYLRGSQTLDLWTFDWNFTDCNNSFNTRGATVFASSELIQSNYYASGFVLLHLNNDPRYNPVGFIPYYLGWNTSDNVAQTGACIHHPNGDYQKYGRFNSIQTYNSTLGYFSAHNYVYIPVGGAWNILFHFGILGTTPSIQGAPVLDTNNRVIGTLMTYNIYSQCSNYKCIAEKISNAWTGSGTTNPQNRLKDWLDPCNTGATVCKADTPLIHPVVMGCQQYKELLTIVLHGQQTKR